MQLFTQIGPQRSLNKFFTFNLLFKHKLLLCLIFYLIFPEQSLQISHIGSLIPFLLHQIQYYYNNHWDMKLLGLVLQNKKGQNIIIASAPSLPTRTCVVYSHLIYEHILEAYRNRLKIERTINLEENLVCACNITKDYIIYVFITKIDLPLAFEAIRKVGDYFNRPGGTSAARMEAIPKKIVQYMSIFEQFLYTRQITFKQYIPMNPQNTSNKKLVDMEIFNKFAHISNQSDKKIIHEAQLLSWRVEANEVKRKLRAVQDAERFQVKAQDEIYLLDIDPEKEKFVNHYRRSIFRTAMGKRRRLAESKSKITSSNSIVNQTMEMNMTTEYLEETILQKQRIKLKIKEKLSLYLQNDKIKQVQQLGQIIIEGTQKQTGTLTLTPQSLWSNHKILSKRISPNSLQIKQTGQNQYKFHTTESYKSKPLIDYVIKTQTFNQDKIPILFIYQMEVNSSNIEFTFKYKINQKWKYKIYQFDINVYLNKDFVVLDCKSIPAANSLKNNKVTWKSKEIIPGTSSAKGKILLAFSQVKFPPKDILAEIKLNMKSNCGLIESLGAEVRQELQQTSSGEKLLLIEYRISPH